MNHPYKLFIVTITLFIFVFQAEQSTAQISNYKAYSIFIYSFSKYVHWPENISNKEFRITVVGKSQVLQELEDMAKIKSSELQKFVVNQINDPSEVKPAHIIYISEGKSGSLPEIIEKTKNLPVLIVTERDGLIKRGAGISFLVTDDNSLRFELNQNDVETRNLKISKNLQTLAYKE